MSSLDKQLSAFRSSVNASSSRFSKRTIAPPGAAAPSPALSQPSATSKQDGKRKRSEQGVVYSQPADTGTGNHMATQTYYAVEYLKDKNRPLPISDLESYLSLHSREEHFRRAFEHIMRAHDRVIYNPRGFDGKGSYSFRPKHDINNSNQLLAALQQQDTFKGLEMKDLRDGWPTADDTVTQLEKEHKLLVTRNKKDNSARHVWPDDPTLALRIDDEFTDIWHKVRIPDPSTVIEELEKADLTPANKARKVVIKTRMPEKKAKKRKAGGKTTNTHMKDLLRDYSHLKK